MTTRLASSILIPLLSSALVSACADDGNGGAPDAAPIDAIPMVGDCGCPDIPPDASPDRFALPEGGEFRLERFQLGPDDTSAELAAQAFFFANQNPPARLIAGKSIPIRPELAQQGYACNDLRDGFYFEPAPADWPTIVPFIGFVNDAGTVEAYCSKLTPGEPEDGRFLVPREVLEIVQADPDGYAVFGRFVHAVWEAEPDRTRMDLIGIESKVSPGFVIQPAPPASR